MSRRITALPLAAAIGAGWGLLCYLVLWGYTPLFPSRSAVVSPIGTILLLPVRLVLWGIRGLERAIGEPFTLAEASAWIGLAAALTGAALTVSITLIVRAVSRAGRDR